MRATVLSIADQLSQDGLVLRCRSEGTDDGFTGDEGAPRTGPDNRCGGRSGGNTVDYSSAFLAAVMPALKAAETALHNGDAGPRQGLWSCSDPVTLFGAVMTRSGPEEVLAAFDVLASSFSHRTSFEYDVIASAVSGDLAYIVGIEHKTALVGGADPLPYALRVTTIFRREDGEWKIIHWHGDTLPDGDPSRNNAANTRVQLGRLATTDSPEHSNSPAAPAPGLGAALGSSSRIATCRSCQLS